MFGNSPTLYRVHKTSIIKYYNIASMNSSLDSYPEEKMNDIFPIIYQENSRPIIGMYGLLYDEEAYKSFSQFIYSEVLYYIIFSIIFYNVKKY